MPTQPHGSGGIHEQFSLFAFAFDLLCVCFFVGGGSMLETYNFKLMM